MHLQHDARQPLPKAAFRPTDRPHTSTCGAGAGVDIHVEVPRVPFQKLSSDRRGEPSAAIRARVEAARARQIARFTQEAGTSAKSTRPAIGLTCNADMGPTQVRDTCQIDETSRQLLGTATLAQARKCQCAPDEPERPRPPLAIASSSSPAPSRPGGQRPHTCTAPHAVQVQVSRPRTSPRRSTYGRPRRQE